MTTPQVPSKFSFEALKALAASGRLPLDFTLGGIAPTLDHDPKFALLIWAALNEHRTVPALHTVLGEPPSQRDADVAAKMLIWMLSAEGASFLQKAEKLSKTLYQGDTVPQV